MARSDSASGGSIALRVRGHEKVPAGGQVAVPTGGYAGSPVVAVMALAEIPQ